MYVPFGEDPNAQRIRGQCDVPAPAGKATREERPGGTHPHRVVSLHGQRRCGTSTSGGAVDRPERASSISRTTSTSSSTTAPVPIANSRDAASLAPSQLASQPGPPARPYGPRRGTAGRHHPPPPPRVRPCPVSPITRPLPRHANSPSLAAA